MQVEISAVRGAAQRPDFWSLVSYLQQAFGLTGFTLACMPGFTTPGFDYANLTGSRAAIRKSAKYLQSQNVIDDKGVAQAYEQTRRTKPFGED